MSITETSDSTRVFVSGLPLNLTSKQLRDHFSKKFDVTDAHVFPDRRIAFVGLTDHESAQKASSYFNKSFVRMSKISVELARPFDLKKDGKGQATPVSKRGLDSRGSESWNAHKRKRDVKDDGENLRGTRARNSEPQSSKDHEERQHVPASEDTEVVRDTAEEETAREKGDKEEYQELPPAAASDSEWLRGKTSRVLDLMDPAEETIEHNQPVKQIIQEENTEEPQFPRPSDDTAEQDDQVDNAADEPPEVSNGRLFLRNLPFTATEDGLTTLFSSFGNIEEVSFPHPL